MRTFIAAALLVLLAVPSAVAGGFATVGIDPAPAAAAPGSTWDARITVLQHGRTPAQGLRPEVLLRSGERIERFTARPAGEPGVYTARVTFPSEGRYRLAVEEGWGYEHRFGTIAVGGDARDGHLTAPSAASPSAGRSVDGAPLPPLVIAAIAGVLAALLTALLVSAHDGRRSARPSTGPSPAAS